MNNLSNTTALTSLITNKRLRKIGKGVLLIAGIMSWSEASLAAFKEYPIATGSNASGITSGPDGNLWFTQAGLSQIGRITTSGVITEYTLPGTITFPIGITTGPVSDGALWFAGFGTSNIGRITTAGTFPTGPFAASALSRPYGITLGPDGNLWFTENFGSNIGRITTSGTVTVTEYLIPTTTPTPFPTGITSGSDGALWFTENGANKIGRIDPTTHIFTEYVIPTATSAPQDITAGPDGALWFTEKSGEKIGRITTSGVITEYALAGGSGPYGITSGSDGNIWFTEHASNKLAKINPATGVITEFQIPTAISNPTGITAGPDGNIWFTESAANQIGVFLLSQVYMQPTTKIGTTVVNYINNLPVSTPSSDLRRVMNALNNLSTSQLNDALAQISGVETESLDEVVKDGAYFVNFYNRTRLNALRHMNSSGPAAPTAPMFSQDFSVNKHQGGLAFLQQKQGQLSQVPDTSDIHMGLATEVNQQAYASNKDGGIWVQALGRGNKQDSVASLPGFDAKTGGLMVGIDRKISQNFIIGAGLGNMTNKVHWKNNGGHGRINGGIATIYGTWFTDGFYVDGALTGGFNHYKINRNIIFTGINKTAKSKHNGLEFTPHLGIGYEINMSCYAVEPFATVDWAYVRDKRYSESGAGVLDLNVNSRKSSGLRSEFGGILSKDIKIEEGVFAAELKLSYVQKNPVKKGSLVEGLSGQSTTFGVDDNNKAQHLFSPGVGVTLSMDSGLFASARYDAELSSKSKSHLIGIKVGHAL